MAFINNPFGSPIGRLIGNKRILSCDIIFLFFLLVKLELFTCFHFPNIESVTDPKHYEPNWSVIIEISDQIRRAELRPEESEPLYD